MSIESQAPDQRQIVDLDGRDVRALTEYLYVHEIAPRLYHVYNEDGYRYLVDLDTRACECDDAQYRNPDGGCKHVRRVEYRVGRRDIPVDIEWEAVDPLLAAHVAGGV